MGIIERLKCHLIKEKELALKARIKELESNNDFLYSELEEVKKSVLDYKILKADYKILTAYINDDEVILELLELDRKFGRGREGATSREFDLRRQAAAQLGAFGSRSFGIGAGNMSQLGAAFGCARIF